MSNPCLLPQTRIAIAEAERSDPSFAPDELTQLQHSAETLATQISLQGEGLKSLRLQKMEAKRRGHDNDAAALERKIHVYESMLCRFASQKAAIEMAIETAKAQRYATALAPQVADCLESVALACVVADDLTDEEHEAIVEEMGEA